MKPGMGWPIGVATLLGVTVLANLWVMRVATNDPSFAIEPDYYQKAVAFDSTMADARRSLTLGWTATSTIVASDSVGRPTVTVTIVDARQAPVEGATVNVVALANARANDILTATLRDIGGGRYQGSLAAQFMGLWEVRVDAVRGTEHFVASTRTTLAQSVDPRTAPDSGQPGRIEP
jgi:nitrogen fixation protein FixH